LSRRGGGLRGHEWCRCRSRGGGAAPPPPPARGGGCGGRGSPRAGGLGRGGPSWPRHIDFAERNSTGTVVHAEYCAPANTLLPPEDGAKCCSRATRVLTATETAAAAAALETLRACR